MDAEEALKEIQNMVDPTHRKTPAQIVDIVRQLSKTHQSAERHRKKSRERTRRFRVRLRAEQGLEPPEARRQRIKTEIALLLAQGVSKKETAERLGISLSGVYLALKSPKGKVVIF